MSARLESDGEDGWRCPHAACLWRRSEHTVTVPVPQLPTSDIVHLASYQVTVKRA